MRPTYFDKGLAKRDNFFGAYEESREFDFGGLRHEKINDLCDVKDRAVVRVDRFVIR